MLAPATTPSTAAKNGAEQQGHTPRCNPQAFATKRVGAGTTAGMLLMAKSLLTTPKLVQTDKVLVTTSESGSIFRPPDAATQEKEMARAPYGTGR